MDVIRKFAAAFVVLSATSLLFVVICPVTPTPIAVAGSHSPDWGHYRVANDHGFVLNPAMAFAGATQHIVATLAGSTGATTAHPAQAAVIDLVCSRLC